MLSVLFLKAEKIDQSTETTSLNSKSKKDYSSSNDNEEKSTQKIYTYYTDNGKKYNAISDKDLGRDLEGSRKFQIWYNDGPDYQDELKECRSMLNELRSQEKEILKTIDMFIDQFKDSAVNLFLNNLKERFKNRKTLILLEDNTAHDSLKKLVIEEGWFKTYQHFFPNMKNLKDQLKEFEKKEKKLESLIEQIKTTTYQNLDSLQV